MTDTSAYDVEPFDPNPSYIPGTANPFATRTRETILAGYHRLGGDRTLFFGERERRAKLLTDAIPTLGDEPQLLWQLAAQAGMDDDRLIDVAASMASRATMEKWSARLGGQPGANQRAEWNTLTDAQKEALGRVGYEPPSHEGGGGLFSDALEALGSVVEVPFDAAGWVMERGGDVLHLVDVVADQPAHLLRTAVYLADSQGGELREGGGMMMNPLDIWEAATSDPRRMWDAFWHKTGDGDDYVLRRVQNQALDTLGGDRDLMAMAREMTEGTSIEELAKRFGDQGTPRYQDGVAKMMRQIERPDFQQALRQLDWGKITFGRQWATAYGLAPGSAPWKAVSGAWDLTFNIVADPFLGAGKVAKVAKARRFGLARGNNMVGRLDEVYQADKATRKALDDIATLFDSGDKGTLMRRHPTVAPALEAMELWSRKYGPIRTGDDMLGYLKSNEGLRSLVAGEWARSTHHVNMLPRLTALGSARIATKEWANQTIRVGAEGGGVFGRLRFGADEIKMPGVDGIPTANRDDLIEGSLLSNTPRIARFLHYATTQIPKDHVALFGRSAPRDISNLVESTGMLAGLPAAARSTWLNEILGAPADGARRLALHNFLDSAFASAGMYDVPETKAFAEKFLKAADGSLQKFATEGLDLHTIDGIERNTGIWLQADRAYAMALPEFRDMATQTARLTMTRQMFGWVNRSWVDAFMGTVWKPSVIMRLGFIPRAAGEEWLAMVLAHPGAYAAIQTARVAVGGEEEVAARTADRIIGARQAHRQLRRHGMAAKAFDLGELSPQTVADIKKRSEYLTHARGLLTVADPVLFAGDWIWGGVRRALGDDAMRFVAERPAHLLAYGVADYYTRVIRSLAGGVAEHLPAEYLEAARMGMSNDAVMGAFVAGVANVNHGIVDRTAPGSLPDDMLSVNVGRGDSMTPMVLAPIRNEREIVDPRTDPLGSFSLWHEQNRVGHGDAVGGELVELYGRYIDEDLLDDLGLWASRRPRIWHSDRNGQWAILDLDAPPSQSLVEDLVDDDVLAGGLDMLDPEAIEAAGQAQQLVNQAADRTYAYSAMSETAATSRVVAEVIGKGKDARTLWHKYLKVIRSSDDPELAAELLNELIPRFAGLDAAELAEATGGASTLLGLTPETFSAHMETFLGRFDDLRASTRGFLANTADRSDLDFASLIFDRTELRNEAARISRRINGHPTMTQHLQASERSLGLADGTPAIQPPEKGISRLYMPMIDRRLAEVIVAAAEGEPQQMLLRLLENAPPHLQNHLAQVVSRIDTDAVLDLQTMMADALVRYGPNDTLIPLGTIAVEDPNLAKEMSDYLAGGIGRTQGSTPLPDVDMTLPIGGQGGYAYIDIPEELVERRLGHQRAPGEAAPIGEYPGGWQVPLGSAMNHHRLGTDLPVKQLEDGTWVLGADLDEILSAIADVQVRRFEQVFTAGPDGRIFHEALGPINIDRRTPLYDDAGQVKLSNPADIADIGEDLPRSVVALKWTAPRENLWESVQRFGFERVISPAIDSIARQPRFMINYAHALRDARAARTQLFDPELWGEAGKIHTVATTAGFKGNAHRLVDIFDNDLTEVERAWLTSGRRGEITKPGKAVPPEVWADFEKIDAAKWKIVRSASANRAHVDQMLQMSVTEAAVAKTIPYIDDHNLRSAGHEFIRNLVPFWYAEEQFLKRWARTLAHSPEALRRGQLLYQGLGHAGVLQENQDGETVFVMPGTPALNAMMTRLMGPVIGASVQMPVASAFTGQVRYATPGFDRLGVPGFGPLVAIPLGQMANRFPELGRSSDVVLGERATTGVLESLVPTSVRRFWDAFTADPASSPQMVTAMTQAMAILDANGLAPDPDATPLQVEEYLDRVENYARVLMLTRAVVGFIAPASPQTTFLENDNLDIATNLGAFADFDEADMAPDYLEHLRLLGPGDGTAEFLRKHPDATAFTVFGTTRASGAPLTPSQEAGLFMEEHGALLNQFGLAGPWLLPQSTDRNSFDRRAYYGQLANEMRVKRSPEEYYRALKFAAAAPVYFDSRRRYVGRLTQARERDDTEARTDLEGRWTVWQQSFFAAHPIFQEELQSPAGQQRRTQVLADLQQAVASPDLAALDIAHMPLITELLDTYQRYKTYTDRAGISRHRAAQAAVEEATLELWAWGQTWATAHPEASALWHGIIEPLLGVDEAELEAKGVLVG